MRSRFRVNARVHDKGLEVIYPQRGPRGRGRRTVEGRVGDQDHDGGLLEISDSILNTFETVVRIILVRDSL